MRSGGCRRIATTSVGQLGRRIAMTGLKQLRCKQSLLPPRIHGRPSSNSGASTTFYMALMTLTTVGYGEVHPLSFHGRLFASFLMLVGVATVFVSFAILGDTLLRLELADYFGRRRRTRMLQHIAGHYIVCGAGRVGRSVVLELLRGGARWCSSTTIPSG